MKGVLICVLAFGLLIVIFALLIGAVAVGMVESFFKKIKKPEKNLSDKSGNESEMSESFLFKKIIDPDPVTDPAHGDCPGNVHYVYPNEEFHIEVHYADSDK